MLKKQWFQIVGHELSIYELEGENTFEKFRDEFPEQFLFLDIDCYSEDQPVDQISKFIHTVRPKSQDLVGKLIKYSKE